MQELQSQNTVVETSSAHNPRADQPKNTPPKTPWTFGNSADPNESRWVSIAWILIPLLLTGAMALAGFG